MTSAAPLRLIPARAGKTTRRRASPPTSRAHPRAGGENRSAPVENRQQEGSSPRGRGKHSHAIPERLHPRLIPARAGKTGGVVRRIAALAAHPRAGGENSSHSSRSSAPPGSSPRGRGKRPSTKKDPRPYGLIPARAGKTHGLVTKASSKPAHPRAGGENESLVGAGVGGGSSPRGRGKPEVGLSDGVPVRLIPARAGKTERAPTSARPRPAHPRAGGENSRMITGRGMQAGSSPRGRGKRQIDTPASRRRGLIPARAGKTCRCRHPHRAAPAHPRAGGENPGAWWLPVVAGGSSPRGRGKPSVSGDGHFLSGSSPRGRGKRSGRRRRRARRGLIPARAGKTNRLARWQTSRTAHPRAGGENGIMVEQHTGELGSSPRGRGKRCVALDTPKIAGLIPARAGKAR